MLSLTQVWGTLLIFVLCPLLGALPLTAWWLTLLTRQATPQPWRREISIATAVVEGNQLVGSLAWLTEVAKGVGTVWLARHYFPTDPGWEIIALMALVMGRYWRSHAVGTTSLIGGAFAHTPVVAGLSFLVGFLGFTLFREKQQGRLLVLGLFTLITALSHPNGMRILLTASLCGLIGWIYQKMPEELDQPNPAMRLESRRLFGFFRSDRALLALQKRLDKDQVGAKAASLSQLLGWGYPVPTGYVLPAGDDPAMLLEITQPSPQAPVIARSSIVGDRPALSSSAGQYPASTNLTSPEALYAAMNQCFRAYSQASALQYRRDRDLPEGSLAVIVQQQVQGLCSGVAFSRDPFTGAGDAVVIEALLGPAAFVTAGQRSPEQWQVTLQPADRPDNLESPDSWRLPEALTLDVKGSGETPQRLLQEVAFLARHLEQRCAGIPQNIEWSFDGDRLWLLQSRPIIPVEGQRGQGAQRQLPTAEPPTVALTEATSRLHALPVCPGAATGKVSVLKALRQPQALPLDTILVVPFLKASDLPAFAQLPINGLIAETGGQLSNGAIAAREYGIPTIVMSQRRDRLQSGQRIHLDSTLGTVDLL
ncbi:MAG: glycerol-3-phosphate acyltransferase [Leptolyngbyaceae cyanobacterium]